MSWDGAIFSGISIVGWIIAIIALTVLPGLCLGWGYLLGERAWHSFKVWRWREFYRKRNLTEADNAKYRILAHDLGFSLRRFSPVDLMRQAPGGRCPACEMEGLECDCPLPKGAEIDDFRGKWIWDTGAHNSARDYTAAFETEADAARHYLKVRTSSEPIS